MLPYSIRCSPARAPVMESRRRPRRRLKGRVEVGYLLLSVDEVDCRGMSAVRVSKVISSRSRNPERTLVLLRGVGRRGCEEEF